KKAFALGQEKHDPILMARSRILQSAIELALADEELDHHADANLHAALAEAYLMRGAAAANDRFQDWEVARSYADKANGLLSKDDRDHLLEELSTLKARIFRATGIDQTLRQWSTGQLGNKTFQQVQEEFAEIVIPKVWISQGKNISRVAQHLSISPKKVRRILRNAHLLSS